MLDFTLLAGRTVTVKKKYYANISEERRARAFAWLRSTGNGDIIKNELSLAFAAGQDAEAKAVRDWLEKEAFSYDEKEAVNANTLKAFVKEQMEAEADADSTGAAAPFPKELFGAFVQDVAEIGAAKKPRKKKEK